ncbi:hypothetical protein ES703_121294 [subsurface metagenome]
MVPGVRSQLFVDFVEITLAEEVKIVLRKDRAERVAIIKGCDWVCAKVHFETVRENLPFPGQDRFKESVCVHKRGRDFLPRDQIQDSHAPGAWQKGPNCQSRSRIEHYRVSAEQSKRIGHLTGNKGLYVPGI